jgi:DNA adenine methylase
MRVPHPISYQGSKRNVAPAILGCFPPRVGTLIEPFAGSAAFTLAAATRGLAPHFEVEPWISESGGTR